MGREFGDGVRLRRGGLGLITRYASRAEQWRRVTSSQRARPYTLRGKRGGVMNIDLARWFDHRVDQITSRTMPIFAARLVAAGLIALAVMLTVDLQLGLVWTAAAASAEAGTWWATRRTRRELEQTVPQRMIYVGAVLWMNIVWSGLGAALWMTDTHAGAVAAICMLASQMLHAQTFASRSPAVLVAVGGPPAAVLLWLAADSGGGVLASSALAIGAATIMVGYMSVAAREHARQAQAVEGARERALAASEAKSAYLAFMSHELRTPLTGVLGMAEALRDQAAGGTDPKLDVLVRTSRSMLAMLNDLLDIAKIEAGKLELNLTSVDIQAKVESVALLWEETARAKGVAITFDVERGPTSRIHSDPLRLRQILNNLVGNALKFTPAGAVAIRAHVEVSGPQAWLQIEVSDTGLGMSADVCSRLFQPFAQADPTVASYFGGTGLGLSICRELSQQMGGQISVASTPGEGSTFSVRLPVGLCEEQALSDAPPPEVGLPGLRVLFVDDNPVNRQVGATLLTAVGCNVSVAENGVVGLEVASSLQPDLIFMDLNMPVMDGASALAALRSNPSTASIPVIALTADAADRTRAAAAASGFDGFETKPLELRRLLETTSQVLLHSARASDAVVQVSSAS